MRRLIRANNEVVDFDKPIDMNDAALLIDAEAIDTVRLRHLGEPMHVMLVDDMGHQKGRRVNAQATHLYHLNCMPGATQKIVGDVLIVPDADYA